MTTTITETYTVTDIEKVIRNIKADLFMIADSTGAISRAEAGNYASDFEALAKKDYLAYVDLTLLNSWTEVKAVRYTVNKNSGELTTSRPGGVLWPKVDYPNLRVVINYTDKFKQLTREEEKAVRDKLTINWVPSTADISHSTLQSESGRNYTSNAYGITRKDYV